jgi:quercetin dioxygenase-like cupin family protein
MRTYPYTIDNGHGEFLTFTRRVKDANGERVEGSNVVKPGKGPPMHVHHLQAEALTVVSGKIGFQRLGQAPQYAGPGETARFEAGDAHRFWNAGETDLHCTALVEPPGNLEYFLAKMFESTKENGGRPSIFDAAYLTRRYRSEYGMMVVPSFVQAVIFPIIIGIGTLLGKYRKFADAPEPLRAPR